MPGCPDAKNAREIKLWEEPQHIKAANCYTTGAIFTLGFLKGFGAHLEGHLGLSPAPPAPPFLPCGPASLPVPISPPGRSHALPPRQSGRRCSQPSPPCFLGTAATAAALHPAEPGASAVVRSTSLLVFDRNRRCFLRCPPAPTCRSTSLERPAYRRRQHPAASAPAAAAPRPWESVMLQDFRRRKEHAACYCLEIASARHGSYAHTPRFAACTFHLLS